MNNKILINNKTNKLLAEWVFWCILVAIFWAQTGAFSEVITEYKFGADGWPKMVLLGLLIGATGQLAIGYYELKQNHGQGDEHKAPARVISRKQQIAIFVVPLIYLWFMHRVGFFIATPIFIATYLRVLEVRNLRYLFGVTAAIYLFVLTIFVRFFYVALPVGAWEIFYNINNQIITIVRLGL